MPNIFRKMNTRCLHNSDIKQLVQVLRTDPSSSEVSGDARFEKATQAAIKELPRRLRSSTMSWHGSLCRSHKGLDTYLINDVWSWIEYELEVGIGRFLYPIVMSGILTEGDEHRVRQLEPVVRMFNTSWTLAESAAPGKTPIDAGTKWIYQENCCPACMLTRLGSDEDALFALFAGMYGHLRSRSSGQNDASKIRSKRLRFVRYWMKTHPGGNRAAEEAYYFGAELKVIRQEVKVSIRRSKRSPSYSRNSLDQPSVEPRHCLDDQPQAVFDLSDPYHLDDLTFIDNHNSKIGPTPPLDPTSRIIIDGWNPNVTRDDLQKQNINIQPPTPRTSIPLMPSKQATPPQSQRRRDSVLSTTSAIRPRPASSIYSVHTPSVTTLRTPRPASYVYSPSALNDSRVTVASSILSYNDPTKPSRPRGYDPLETADEWVDKCTAPLKAPYLQGHNFKDQRPEGEGHNAYMAMYRTPQPFNTKSNRREAIMLEGDFRNGVVLHEGQILPKPSRCSMYSAFGEEGRDGSEFEVVDQTPPPSPIEEKYEEEGVGECTDRTQAGNRDGGWYDYPYGDCRPAPLQTRKHG